MIKLIKLFINFTIYLLYNLKSAVHLANAIAIIQGKSLNFGQSDYPRTPKDTPGHSGTALFVFSICYMNV